MKLSTAVLVIGLLGIGLFVISGCQQGEQAETAGEQAETTGEAMTEEGGHMMPDAGMMGDLPEDKAFDVACGMVIDKEGAASAEYKGHTFYFCSESCKADFDAAPEEYMEKMREMKMKAKAMEEEGGEAKEAGEMMEGM